MRLLALLLVLISTAAWCLGTLALAFWLVAVIR
jgi:hypothetical protein